MWKTEDYSYPDYPDGVFSGFPVPEWFVEEKFTECGRTYVRQ